MDENVRIRLTDVIERCKEVADDIYEEEGSQRYADWVIDIADAIRAILDDDG